MGEARREPGRGGEAFASIFGLDSGATEAEPESGGAEVESLEFRSDHGLLKACHEDTGWEDEGAPCPKPEWTPERESPVSHTMGEPIRLALTLRDGARGAALAGAGPGGLAFEAAGHDGGPVLVTSTRPLARRIQKLALDVRWSLEGGAPAGRTSNAVYVTMGRPVDDAKETWKEDGVTLKRMDAAVSLVSAMETLDPHEIMAGLMSIFPYYTLQPSPKVPRKYGHPAYFNNAGGAWAMADYVEETGECQAIARFIRAVLRQLGIPGELRILLVWADPRVDGGRTPIEVDWEENPSGGLDATTRIRGRRAVAALIDRPVEEGKVYPPSHTRLPNGRASPGLNRYEAYIRFSHGGKTLYYAPGAGVLREGESRLQVFWGLAWVSAADDEGFRVEKIVTRYK